MAQSPTVNEETDGKEIEIPVPWGYVKGKWWGSKTIQPILAIHGWQDNAGTFDGIAAHLPSDMSLLCIDLPGHGLSSHYPNGQFYYLFWDGLLLVRRIVKHYNWKKVSILGHSLGGAIGFLYAATYPEETENLICIDIACPTVKDTSKIIADSPAIIDRFLKYEHLTEADMPCYSYNEMVDLVLDAYRGALTRTSCETLMKRGMAPAPESVQESKGGGYHFCRDVRLKVAGLGFLSLDLVLQYAQRITCRYLNIRGIPGMSFDKPEYYELVVDKIKETASKFEYHEIEGTHHLHLNNPGHVAPIIIEFLKAK